MFADRRLALAVEGRINQRELPGRGRLLGEDAIATAEEVQILGFVADLCQRGKSRTDVKIDVAEIRMLRDMEANGNCGRIALADFKIDVAYRRIERIRIGVRNGLIWRHASRWRKWNLIAGSRHFARRETREDDH